MTPKKQKIEDECYEVKEREDHLKNGYYLTMKDKKIILTSQIVADEIYQESVDNLDLLKPKFFTKEDNYLLAVACLVDVSKQYQDTEEIQEFLIQKYAQEFQKDFLKTKNQIEKMNQLYVSHDKLDNKKYDEVLKSENLFHPTDPDQKHKTTIALSYSFELQKAENIFIEYFGNLGDMENLFDKKTASINEQIKKQFPNFYQRVVQQHLQDFFDGLDREDKEYERLAEAGELHKLYE